MFINLIDKLGDYNPQFLREIKGRLKPLNVIIAVGASLLQQLIIFLIQLGNLPNRNTPIGDTYCLLNQLPEKPKSFLGQQKLAPEEAIYNFYTCPADQINWAKWWLDNWEYTFLILSIMFIFVLIVGGTYLLINDLAQEERRGTLNFIRLSPQSETNILTGKLIGVPILIYLFVFTAIPFHFWAGFSAQISPQNIFLFYIILAAISCFFHSAALLFGLVSRPLRNFQPWVGSGVVLLFLLMSMELASSHRGDYNNATAVLRLLSPWDIATYVFSSDTSTPIRGLQFFGLPIGQNIFSLLGFSLGYYGIFCYGIWRSIKRCFRNPNTTIISKRESYIWVAITQLMLWGFTMFGVRYDYDLFLVFILGLFNSALILGLIFVLSHQRQTIIDWARYRHQNQTHGESLWTDLIWGEKSPAILAIFINLIIATTPTILWIIFAPANLFNQEISKETAFLAVALCVGLMMIYTTIAQIILLQKTQQRVFWSVGSVSALIVLPPIILQILREYPTKENALAWLFSTFPWAGLRYADSLTSSMVILCQFTVIVLLNYQLNRQVRVLGESASKALLSGR